MLVSRTPIRALAAFSLVALVLIIAAYSLTAWRLSVARQARRDDDCVAAETWLAGCWPVPGLSNAIELEDQLLAVQQGDLRDEKAWQSRANDETSHGQLIWEALAKGNLATFQWTTAESQAEAILRQQPGDARALWLRARARIEMHSDELALADLERALELETNTFVIRCTYADLLHRLGQVAQAISQYERLRSQRPDDDRVTLALAQCWQEQADLQQSRSLLDEMLQRRPDHVGGLIERGRLALRMGESSAAEECLRRAVAIRPDHHDANFVLGLALQAQQKVDPELAERIRQNDHRQADVIRSLSDAKPAAALLTEVGQWMAQTGQEQDSAAWFYPALKEDSSYRPAHRALAELYGNNGQTRRAQTHARLAGADLKRHLRPSTATGSLRAKRESLAKASVINHSPESEAAGDDVRRLCAACHAYPSPESMPRWAWRKEVKQGYDFLHNSALSVDYPPLESVVQYYERRAPERFQSIEQPPSASTPPVKFEQRGTGWMPNTPPFPAVASAQLAGVFGKADEHLLLTESRLNALLLIKPNQPGPGGMVISGLTAPCHTTVADLDGDGQNDILVASLGQFFPTNDKLGQVLWLKAGADGQFATKTILNYVGRVADIQTADFNGDGRLDLVVAVFGWRTTGEILYLENRTSDWSQPRFIPHAVDSRHGAIHVPVADLNGDGRPDFIGLISQEHETVVAYVNEGDGSFRQETIFVAPHPSFGSSGIELVDMDGDRDVDVLLTNGDILDRPHILKPYHGVQWLENSGSYPYEHHLISPLHGAARAVAADFDSDGDQDVLAVTLLPQLLFPEREKLRLPAVVLYEQQSKSQFAPHVLETGTCDHFSCATGDWDHDGGPDFVIGNFAWAGSQPMRDAAILWRNAGRP